MSKKRGQQHVKDKGRRRQSWSCIHCGGANWVSVIKPEGQRRPLACLPCVARWRRMFKGTVAFPNGGEWGSDPRFLWPTRAQVETAIDELEKRAA